MIENDDGGPFLYWNQVSSNPFAIPAMPSCLRFFTRIGVLSGQNRLVAILELSAGHAKG